MPQCYEVSFPSYQVLLVALECDVCYVCYVHSVISSRVMYLPVQLSHLAEADLPSKLLMDASEAFDAAAWELMLKQGMKPSQLYKPLKRITEAASKDLPLLQVLSCSSYGGYGYSDI